MNHHPPRSGATLVLVAVFTFAGTVEAATTARGPFVGAAAQHDVSPPLRDVVPLEAPARGPNREVPLRAAPQRNSRPASGRSDPIRQVEARPDPAAAPTLAPSVDIEGLSDDDNAATVGFRVVPPDTEGDIGPGHYVQYINSIFAVWNVTRDGSGAPTGVTLAHGFPKPGNAPWAGFGGPCQNNNDGDPIALYDHLADRWLLSQFSIDEGIQCVALSTSGDPTGTYDRWAFGVSPGENNDYPKIGLMPGAYYLSLRDFPSNDGTFASFLALDRAAMLAGNPAATFVKFSLPCLATDCPDGVQPPHLEGPPPAASTPGDFTRAWDVEFEGGTQASDGYRVWRLTPDFATPANSTFVELPYIASAGFDSTMCGFFQRGCIQQPPQGGGERLDPLDELQMYRAQFRHFEGHDALLLSTTVDSTGDNVAGMRWAELRNTGSGWTLHQEGTYAPADGENRWMGSVAMNGEGDVALGYSVASSGTYPSIRYTSRQAGDALGTLPGGEVEVIAGAGSQTSSFNRWGDYSAMSVDPVDDCTFWYTQEYYANTASFDFKTRIAAFPGPSCGGGGCEPTGAEAGNCGDGVDNDCDGFVDCLDSDCSGDPLCAGCTLGEKGDPCVVDGDCCSNRCKGKPGAKTCK
ncbi:MAG TPA: hypothetical protein VGC00_14530 [Thermoanaerobaculia bacterium]|jgi:hypothetical protein